MATRKSPAPRTTARRTTQRFVSPAITPPRETRRYFASVLSAARHAPRAAALADDVTEALRPRYSADGARKSRAGRASGPTPGSCRKQRAVRPSPTGYGSGSRASHGSKRFGHRV